MGQEKVSAPSSTLKLQLPGSGNNAIDSDTPAPIIEDVTMSEESLSVVTPPLAPGPAKTDQTLAMTSEANADKEKKKPKVRRSVSFGAQADVISAPGAEAAPKASMMDGPKSDSSMSDGTQMEATGLAALNPAQEAIAREIERAIIAQMAAESNEKLAEAQEASVYRTSSDNQSESLDSTPRSDGMKAVSHALRNNPCSWGDGAGEWHPSLMQEDQPRTRCWGPMSWADSIEEFSHIQKVRILEANAQEERLCGSSNPKSYG